MDKLGERIFALRTAKNMSQGDLAAALDVSRQAVSKWENGMGTPTPENIVAMSALFGVTTDYILVGKENAAEEKAGEAPRAEEGFGKRKNGYADVEVIGTDGKVIIRDNFIHSFCGTEIEDKLNNGSQKEYGAVLGWNRICLEGEEYEE